MSRFLRHIPAVMLLAVFWGMGISASLEDSVTSDELFHITAGFSYWRTGSFRLQPENGLIPQLVAGLPLAMTDRGFDFQAQQEWWRVSHVPTIGWRLFFNSDQDPHRLLIQARMICGLIGAALGATIYCWSLRLFGLPGAYASLFLFAFSPLMLSHGVYATSDAAAALMFLWTLAAMNRLCAAPSFGWAIVAGAAAAGLALSKFSAPLIVPMILLLLVMHRPGFGISGHLALSGVTAWLLIWTAYGWHFAAVPMGDRLYPDGWIWALDPPTISTRIVELMRQWRALPEAWLYGLAHTLHGSSRSSYLMGQIAPVGRWHYFPVAMLIKTPLAILAAIPLVRWNWNRRLAPLIILICVYFTAAIWGGLCIGLRHLLPVYAAGLILMGGLAAGWETRWKRIVLVILAIGLTAESIAARPGYLAHFNPLIARSQRFRWLADSNLDWGQDLYRLANWIRHTGRKGVYVATFGYVRLPLDETLKVRDLPGIPQYSLNENTPLEPGTYCISANLLLDIMGEIPAIPPEIPRLYAHLRKRDPDQWIGDSIAVYQVTRQDIDASRRP